jgi:predicted RNA binding protein YcfA (HicA-like mRNA interferase family)
MLRILYGLGYVQVRQNGSHRMLRAAGRSPITFATHPGASLAPGLVREILVKQAGLTEDEALKEVGAK